MPAQSADPGKEIKDRVPREGKFPGWQWTDPSGLTAIRGGLQSFRRIRVQAMALTALASRRVQGGAAAALSWALTRP